MSPAGRLPLDQVPGQPAVGRAGSWRAPAAAQSEEPGAAHDATNAAARRKFFHEPGRPAFA